MLNFTFIFPFAALEFICIGPPVPLASASSTLILDLYFSSRALIRLFCCHTSKSYNKNSLENKFGIVFLTFLMCSA